MRVNENRIHEELPGPVRHDFCPACIRNSCYCDGNNNNEINGTQFLQYDSLYDIEPQHVMLPVKLNLLTLGPFKLNLDHFELVLLVFSRTLSRFPSVRAPLASGKTRCHSFHRFPP